jgi:putative mRNA 3-end processing factor
MDKYPIEVSRRGGAVLNGSVVCDGFVYGVPNRVQTHVHDDHMSGFDESKGFQDIYMTPATRELLDVERNAEIGVRKNIKTLEFRQRKELEDGNFLSLWPSGHMLGGAQVLLETSAGLRLGYSSDFSWPLDPVFEVDALCLDSTNGSPRSVRSYTQIDAEARLAERVTERIRLGSIRLKAHRGVLHRCLGIIDTLRPIPVLASPHRCREIAVYRAYGYSVPDVLDWSLAESRKIASEERCIYLYSKGDRDPVDCGRDTTIIASAYMCQGDEPELQYSERSCRIALSDHADFNGVLDYVKASCAKYVLVDNTRGSHALELAMALSEHLGIVAVAADATLSLAWGT